MKYEIKKHGKFVRWFEKLKDRRAKVLIYQHIERLEDGFFGDSHGVGGSVSELRVHYGPGYRVYFTEINGRLIVLLAGGKKDTQRDDIAEAKKIAKQLQEEMA
jgi:putative addiction module killer protein